MRPPVPQEYDQWMEQLQTIDFVLIELHLYLDTHPGDAQALEQYRAWNERRKAVAAQFEARFGPLTAGGDGRPARHWEWVDSPWPWQV